MNIVIEPQSGKPNLEPAPAPDAAAAPAPKAKKTPAAKREPFDPARVDGMPAVTTGKTPANSTAAPTTPAWNPRAAAEFVVAPHNAAGLVMYSGEKNRPLWDAWKADPGELGDHGAEAFAHILDHTPLNPAAGGILGLIPQLVIGAGALIRLEVKHWTAVEAAKERMSRGVMPGVYPSPPADTPFVGAPPAGPLPADGGAPFIPPTHAAQAAPVAPPPPVASAPAAPAPPAAGDPEGPLYSGADLAFLQRVSQHAEHQRRSNAHP